MQAVAQALAQPYVRSTRLVSQVCIAEGADMSSMSSISARLNRRWIRPLAAATLGAALLATAACGGSSGTAASSTSAASSAASSSSGPAPTNATGPGSADA